MLSNDCVKCGRPIVDEIEWGQRVIKPFANSSRDNPVTAIDLQTKDGTVLRFRLPEIQQERVMWAIGVLHHSLGVGLDLELPEVAAGAAVGEKTPGVSIIIHGSYPSASRTPNLITHDHDPDRA